MPGGYLGKILVVDLTQGQWEVEPLREEHASRFLGGGGLACRYLYDLISPSTDPLGPDNILFFTTGPLVGTRAPSCGRYTACFLSPLTGIWGESNAGGFFGPEMRFAGYDGILIRGRSPEPVYLWINDGKVEVRPASHLWGLDTYRVQEAIKEEIGEPRAKIACIGPAGEKLVKMAAIINDNARAAARGGPGAVMGSKNLKAIAVKGSGTIPLHNEAAFNEVAREARDWVREDFTAQLFHSGGTAFWMDLGHEFGDVPIKYFTKGYFEGTGKLSGATMAETILVKTSACYGCPIACGRVIEVKEGQYKLPVTEGPEYETLCSLGTLLMVDNLAAVSYANHLCNSLGLDTISVGVTIAFAYYLFDRGVVSEREVGFALKWGDPEGAIRLIELISRKEGFGAILAEGVRSVGERFGLPEEAAHVKGLEVPMHEPRAFFGSALAYATSPRGACHMQGDPYAVDSGSAIPEIGIIPGDRFSAEDKAWMVARIQDWRALYNSMIMCQFCSPGPERIAKLLREATGWDIGIEELVKIGRDIFDLKRAFNVKMGVKRQDDHLPSLLLRPLPDGGAQGAVPDMEKLLADYYAVRDWTEEGTLKPERMRELGLA
jgi:aldehyde:ferredoxin oxidoreductase